MLSSFIGKAANYTWLGGTSAWNTTSNWNLGSIPDSLDNVTIGNTAHSPVLDTIRKVNNLTLTTDSIDLNYFVLIVKGTATFNSGVVLHGTIKPQGQLCHFGGTKFDATIIARCGYFHMNGGQFELPVTLEDTGYASTTGTGASVFNDSLNITHYGTVYFTMATTTGDVFNGPVKLINYSTHEINIASSDSSTFNDNIIVNSTNGGGILFGNTGGKTVLASGKTISVGSVGFTNDYLTLKKFTQLGNTSQTLTVTSTASVNFIDCAFNGNLAVSASGFLLKNCIFNGTSDFTKNGTANYQSDGGNTFNGATTISNSGSAGRIRLATITADTFVGNATFNSTGQDHQVAYSGDNIFQGNITINSTKVVFNTLNGRVVFSGLTSQTINGSYNYAFKKLKINKSSNHVTANTTLSVDDSLEFVSGNLVTTSSNLLTMKAGSKALNFGNSSYVNGPVKKIGNTSFIFPVGKDSIQNSIEISSPTASTDAFTAEYFNVQQSLGSTMDSTIDYISNCNYWNLSRDVGSANVNVYLNWHQGYCGILDSADLRVTGWNGSTWKDYGQNSFVGIFQAGKVRNNSSITTFHSFALGYKTTTNPYSNLGPDTTVAIGSITLNNVSAYGNLLWYPKADLSCTDCLNPVADLAVSRKYFLETSDYKGRTALDSVFVKVIQPLSQDDFLPPALDWKATDWAPEDPYTMTPLDWDDSGDEWWYSHDNSYDVSGVSPVMNGYICGGYASFINTELDESSFSGCEGWNAHPAQCYDFETDIPLLNRGLILTALALKPLPGKGFTWFKNYEAGAFIRVKMTSDGGYLACGVSDATVDRLTGDPLIYNKGQTLTDHSICDATTSNDKKTHAFIIKTDKDGVVEWKGIYGYATFNDIDNNIDLKSSFTSFVEIPGEGYRLVGKAEHSNMVGNRQNGWILDLSLTGEVLDSYILPSFTNQIASFHAQYPSDVRDILFDPVSEEFFVSGTFDDPGQNPYKRQSYVFESVYNFGMIDLNSDVYWINLTDLDNYANSQLNTVNHYINFGKLDNGTDILLVPVIYDCFGCLYAEEFKNFGEGRVYRMDKTDGHVIDYVSIGEVMAYDMKIDAILTEEDNGFAVLSTKTGFNSRTFTSPCISNPDIPIIWNTDASVTKFDSSSPIPEWQIQFDVNDRNPAVYPGDYKKQECMYTITRANDGGFVLAGNNSYNFDDFYLCKLQSDCHSRASFDSDMNLDSEYEMEITGNEVWDHNMEVFGKIIIRDNAKLTIENGATITFADSRRISDETGHNIITALVVDPGGELEIREGSILDVIDSGCEDGMWDGIQVLGQPNMTQSVANQGFLNIHDGSTIKNARIGICADEADYDNKFEYLYGTNTNGGGIVHATDGSIFENNREGIWIGPFKQGYSVDRIISNSFISTSLLRDPFYKASHNRQEALSGFIRLRASSPFNIENNTFTGLNTMDVDIKGTGINCNNCGTNIFGENIFTDLTKGIVATYRIPGSVRRPFISNNTFSNVYFGIYCLGGSFASIQANSFTIPDRESNFLQPYGIWMDGSRDYLITNRNYFFSDEGDDNIGVIASNSATSVCEIFYNTFDGTSIGTQTEKQNSNLQIRCNTYENHFAHSWLINPQSPGGNLSDQGTGCPSNGGRTAGNSFYDGCTDPVGKNLINSTIQFNYYANGTAFTWPNTNCSSDILSNTTSGEIINCSNTIDDPLACLIDEPAGNNREEWLDVINAQEDRTVKAKLWTSFIHMLIAEDSLFEDNSIISYLDSLENDDNKWYKITWYMDRNDSTSVDSLMNVIPLVDDNDSSKFEYYNLLRSKMGEEGSYFNLSHTDIDNIEIWFGDTLGLSKSAYSWVGAAKLLDYDFIPEHLGEARVSMINVSEDSNGSTEILIFPSPNNGNFTVTTKMIWNESTQVLIINSFGQVIKNISTSDLRSFEVNASDLTQGIYLLSVTNSIETINTKFVIQH